MAAVSLDGCFPAGPNVQRIVLLALCMSVGGVFVSAKGLCREFCALRPAATTIGFTYDDGRQLEFPGREGMGPTWPNTQALEVYAQHPAGLPQPKTSVRQG